MQNLWIIKFLRSFNKGHLQFLDFNKVEIIRKSDARVLTTILNDNSI